MGDGSCLYKGCMQPDAFNYDPSATQSGECVDTVLGCLESAAHNYRPGANTADGSCKYIGCTDSVRPNYDPTATDHDSGGCGHWFPGCTNSRSRNYKPEYNQDDGTCKISGCMNKTSSFFDPEATYDPSLSPRVRKLPFYGCACKGTCT